MPKCRTCKRPIKWYATELGSNMPLDPEPKPDGNVVLRGMHDAPIAHVLTGDELLIPGELRFSCHFETCPDADTHRRRRRRAA